MPTRSIRSSFARILNASLFALLMSFLCASPIARTQQTPNPIPQHPGIPGVNPDANGQDNESRRMNEQMSMKRNNQRQQEIVADSAHLLDLAQKLNTEVAKSDKNTLSLSVVKEADQIEKLAKSIKEKMRDGQ